MRTNLSDGGYIEHSWSQGSISVTRYNAAGQETARTNPISSTTADYQAVALDNGGFVIGANLAVRYGFDVALYVFDASTRMFHVSADPSGTVQSATSWQIMAGAGGFAFSWLTTSGPTGVHSQNAGFAIYNNAGQMLSSERLTDRPTISRTAEGDYRFDWSDGRYSHSLVVDSEAPRDYPPAPAPAGLQLVDDQGPNTGLISEGGVTDDRTPGFRVPVTEPGWVAVALEATGGHPNRFLQITAEDLARGYKELSITDAWPNETYDYGQVRVTARFLSADGIPGPSTSFIFGLDTSPPNAPAIARVVDDAGAQQGDVAPGGSTDDTTPTVHVSLAGTQARAGDNVQLYNGGAPVASVLVTAAAVQQGSISVSPTLSAGSYDLTAHVRDEAGNLSPGSTAFNLTVSSGSGSCQVITSPGPGSTLAGGEGNDTLIASQGPDVLTGGGGGDAFVYRALPWNAGRITDFALGTDRLDLAQIFRDSGYSGSDPVADGRMRFDSDGAGGTRLYFDRDAPNGGDWPFLVTTLQNVSPSGLTWAQLSGGGAPPPPPSGEPGQVLTWRQHGDTLTGGAGNDTLNGSRGPDQLTGGDGGDHFAWAELPWSAGHVTDFTPGLDKLDLRALFRASGYSGSNPIADGRLEFRSDGAGNTSVYFDADAPGAGQWPFLITTLDGIAPSQVGAGDWLFR